MFDPSGSTLGPPGKPSCCENVGWPANSVPRAAAERSFVRGGVLKEVEQELETPFVCLVDWYDRK